MNKHVHHLKPCLGRSQASIKCIAPCIKHTMATIHRGTGCPLGRDIDLHIEDSENTGLDNNSESTSGSDSTVALGGPEAERSP